MADTIAKVDRFSIEVPAKPGEGARVLGSLAAGKADLLAVWGYPLGSSGKVKIEVVPADTAVFKAAAKAAKIKVKKESAAFCVVGRNKVGALAEAIGKLGEKGITIHAAQAIAVGGKYGALVEVEAKDVRKAARALGV